MELLERRTLLSHAHGRAFGFTLDSLNNSGVTGQGTIIERRNQVQVDMEVSGLEPDQVHPQHIHGFGEAALNVAGGLTSIDKESGCPPPTAATLLSPDALGPQLISVLQGQPSYGPIMKDLVIPGPVMGTPSSPDSHMNATGGMFPTAPANGHLSYHETLSDQTNDGTTTLGDLALREIVVHGAFVSNPDAQGNRVIVHPTTPGTTPPNATYIASLPLACGHINPLAHSRGHHRGR